MASRHGGGGEHGGGKADLVGAGFQFCDVERVLEMEVAQQCDCPFVKSLNYR